jgi:hypothetical protein
VAPPQHHAKLAVHSIAELVSSLSESAWSADNRRTPAPSKRLPREAAVASRAPSLQRPGPIRPVHYHPDAFKILSFAGPPKTVSARSHTK